MLMIDEAIEFVETMGIADFAVKPHELFFDQLPQLRGMINELFQLTLDLLNLLSARGRLRDVVVTFFKRQIRESIDNFFERRVGLRRHSVDLKNFRQDQRIGIGAGRKFQVRIIDREGAIRVGEAQLSLLEDFAVVRFENRNEDALREHVAIGIPMDVEKIRVGRIRSALENIAPPRVERALNAHVIGHEI